MANYTDEQKNKIIEMPAAVLLDAIMADVGSAIVGMREFLAGESFITKAAAKYPGNTVIQEVTKGLNLPKLEEAAKPVFSAGNLDEMRARCSEKINDGLSVLANDEEANQFKAFLLALADSVVNAAGEGFFGNRGERVSAKEAEYLNQLKQRLNV